MIQTGIAMTPSVPVNPLPILRLDGITKSFGPVAAVKPLSLAIGRHEVVGLIGENGAGKSTLLKMLTGVHRPDAGTIEMNGRALRLRGPQDAVQAGLGIVHQEQSLFTNLTVAENIVMGAGPHGSAATKGGLYRWSALRREAEEVLARIGSTISPDAIVGELTFAQRQMVEIARTIHVACQTAERQGGAPLVILDEPTSVLEKAETEVLEAEIDRLKRIGSVIFVSHRLEEVLRICDRIVVMRHGELVADRPTLGVTEADLFRLMIGKDRHAEARGAVPVPAGAPVMRVAGLSRAGAFKDINLDVHAGRITAIVGSFGAGREELVRALYGAESHDAGRIEVAGHPVSGWSPRRAIRAGVAYLPAERGVESAVGGLSAARNLTMVPFGANGGWVLSPARRKALAAEWFEKLDIRPRLLGQELERFSGGNQQKVVLAKWLTLSPKVLILDHPLRGLDPGAGATVNACIRQAAAQGAGVILLADTLEEALDLGHEVIVMRDGEISARFDMGRDNPTTLDLLENMV
ncbi:sugar ABC transporter ATP-binding protein [Neotabrizicola shimadae]|uniref:Sugar ABC transporter ATP-binding protein n=1 Tax=Neotabrizicola shimadae TaxID=2807096 RepID=A0A8G1EBE2_9RHOB|nr:sugar ABC transporter ATP-binding protein [Neotabrizicola shimadae]QYZ69535.1 sugar ABC transporter ATP-binding protein [Neotabrizicola shimadae]